MLILPLPSMCGWFSTVCQMTYIVENPLHAKWCQHSNSNRGPSQWRSTVLRITTAHHCNQAAAAVCNLGSSIVTQYLVMPSNMP